MKWRLLIGFVFGLVLMIASVELYAKENVFFASVAGIFAAYMFLLSGVEIGEQRKKLKCEPVKFEKLEPGIYLFMTTPVQHINCSPTGECNLYFMFLECNGETVSVVVGVSAKLDIQEAMRGKFINQIEKGEGIKIDKNHNVTKIET